MDPLLAGVYAGRSEDLSFEATVLIGPLPAAIGNGGTVREGTPHEIATEVSVKSSCRIEKSPAVTSTSWPVAKAALDAHPRTEGRATTSNAQGAGVGRRADLSDGRSWEDRWPTTRRRSCR